jgi:hypothetical protein
MYLQMRAGTALSAHLAAEPVQLLAKLQGILRGHRGRDESSGTDNRRAFLIGSKPTLSLTFTSMAESSTVLPPPVQERVAQVLEDDAEVMSNTQLEQLLASQPEEIQDEAVRINTDARPLALQVALLIPILAALVGLFNSFRMMRLPDPTPSTAADGMVLG